MILVDPIEFREFDRMSDKIEGPTDVYRNECEPGRMTGSAPQVHML